jgi:glutathione synthase/RimK-type ligase-like ATP-grasp enzyme
MANVVRRIGLSLGADICWPICYEELIKHLDLEIDWRGDRVSLEVDRVTIEPFDLRQPCRYDLVIDRLTHWYHTSREWIKKSVVMDGLYVFNNPWSVQSMEKHTTYSAMMHLGMPIPDTWMVPPKSYEPLPDLKPTLDSYAKLFDLPAIGKALGYPLFMKPYDGGGWKGVSRIDDAATLRARYEESGKLVMHLQKAVHPFDSFVRCIGLGAQTKLVRYDPGAALHDRYTMDKDFVSAEEAELLRDTTLTINAFFGWDFNSCESLRKDGTWYPIDFANPCPDSQVTSLHYHFPWLVMANIRWSVFTAVTKRAMRRTLDWEPFYKVAAEKEMPYRDRLRAYARIAAERFDTAHFEDFCARHLGHLDEVAWEFFGTQVAKDAVRKKVTALFPTHEIEPFTELFWRRIQAWRADAEAEARGTRSA